MSRIPLLLGTLLVSLPVIVSACTLCDSALAGEVRAGVMNEKLWYNVLLAVLPSLENDYREAIRDDL